MTYIKSMILDFKADQAADGGSAGSKVQKWPKRLFSLPSISYNVHYTK